MLVWLTQVIIYSFGQYDAFKISNGTHNYFQIVIIIGLENSTLLNEYIQSKATLLSATKGSVYELWDESGRHWIQFPKNFMKKPANEK